MMHQFRAFAQIWCYLLSLVHAILRFFFFFTQTIVYAGVYYIGQSPILYNTNAPRFYAERICLSFFSSL